MFSTSKFPRGNIVAVGVLLCVKFLAVSLSLSSQCFLQLLLEEGADDCVFDLTLDILALLALRRQLLLRLCDAACAF